PNIHSMSGERTKSWCRRHVFRLSPSKPGDRLGMKNADGRRSPVGLPPAFAPSSADPESMYSRPGPQALSRIAAGSDVVWPSLLLFGVEALFTLRNVHGILPILQIEAC